MATKDLVFDLEALVRAGDESAWTLEDWEWDSAAFTAKQVHRAGSPAPCCGVKRQRSGLLACEGLQAIQLLQHSQASPLATTSGCSTEEEPFNAPLGSLLGDLLPETPARQEEDGTPGCQADGCARDLTALTTYHQRCHICDAHIKAPQYRHRNGALLRFCQQCGRAHELAAFDGMKKSCRVQLAKHNARRRRKADIRNATPCASRIASQLDSLDVFWQPPAPTTVMTALVEQPTGADKSSQSALLPSAEPAMGFPAPTALGQPLQDGDLFTDLLPPSTPTSASSFDQAAALMRRNASQYGPSASVMPPQQAPPYSAEHTAVRLSVKLFNCTPAELPDNLRQQLTGWLKSTPVGVEGYIRPGCVHLVMDAYLSPADARKAVQEGIGSVVAHLTSQPDPVWTNRIMLLELAGQTALVKHSQLMAVWHLNADNKLRSAAIMPRIASLSRAAVPAGKAEGAVVRVSGYGLSCKDCRVLCRSRGRYLDMQVDAHPFCCQSGACHTEQEAEQTLSIGLPPDLQPGLVWVECQRGGLLSAAVPLVVTPSRGLAVELNAHMESTSSSGGLLTDLGLILGMLRDGPDLAAWQGTVTKLLAHACQAGLPQLFTAIIAAALPTSVETLDSSGLSLLHEAVRSEQLDILQALLNWAGQRGCTLRADVAGPGGLTPLHLAALLPAALAPAVCRLLTRCCPPYAAAWLSVRTADGLAPSDFAVRVGALALDGEMRRATPVGQKWERLGYSANERMADSGVLSAVNKMQTCP